MKQHFQDTGLNNATEKARLSTHKLCQDAFVNNNITLRYDSRQLSVYRDTHIQVSNAVVTRYIEP